MSAVYAPSVAMSTGEVRSRDSTREYGGFVTRTIAFAIDAAIIDLVGLVVAALVTLVFSLFPVSDRVHDVALVAGGALFVIWSIAYFVAFWTTTGETPGNRAMRLRVVRANGSRLRPRHALLRIVGMLLSFPLLWGYLPILVNDRRRGFHDVLAGTVVLAGTSDPAAPALPPADSRPAR